MGQHWIHERAVLSVLGREGRKSQIDLVDAAREQHLPTGDLRDALGSLSDAGVVTRASDGFYSLTPTGRARYEALCEFPDLHPVVAGIYVDTRTDSDLGRYRRFIYDFSEDWIGNFLHPLGDDLLEAGALDNSVMFCYLAAQSEVFIWLSHSAFNGAYEVVLRELRTILEGMFPAYRVEQEAHGATLDEKLDILEQLEAGYQTHGKKAFKGSHYEHWRPYYRIYQDLSKYVHLTRRHVGHQMKAIADRGFPEFTGATYDRDRFLTCAKAWHKIAGLSADMAVRTLELAGFAPKQTNPRIFELDRYLAT